MGPSPPCAREEKWPAKGRFFAPVIASSWRMVCRNLTEAHPVRASFARAVQDPAEALRSERMRLIWSRSGPASAATPPQPAALDFPRADGPSRTVVTPQALSPAPGLPVARFSVASIVIGMLVIVTVWSLGASSFVNHLGLRHALESKQLDRAVRAAVTVESTLLADASELEARVRPLASDEQLLSALGGGTPAVAALGAARRRTGADRFELYESNGRAIAGIGAGGEYRAGALTRPQLPAADAPRQLVVDGDALLLRFAVRLQPSAAARQDGSAGYLVAERRIDRAYLRKALAAIGADVVLFDERGQLL